MTEVANLVAVLRAEAAPYVAGIQQAVAADESLIASHRKTIATAQEVGGALSRFVTVPILAAGAASLKLSIDFQTAFAKVAQAANLPSAAVKSLQSDVLKLAEATAQSPTQLASTLVGVERSGVGAANALSVLTVAGKESAVGLATQANAADAVTSAMNAYGPSVLTAAQAGDILTTGAQTSKLSIDDLSGSLGRALPAAAALGLGFGQLVAAEATMTREGLSAGQAGMSLFRILSSIENPSSTATKALKDLGLTAAGAKDQIAKGDFEGLLSEIAKGASGNAQALLQLTGGIRGASGAFALLANDGKTMRDEFAKVQDSSGSLDALMGKIAGTTGFQLRQAITSVEVALIKWGDAIAPVAEHLAGLVKDGADFVGWLGSVNPLVKDVAVGFLAFAAAAGPLILLGGSLAKAWLAFSELLNKATADTAAGSAADRDAAAAATERAAAVDTLTSSITEQAVAETAATEARASNQLSLFAGSGEGIAAGASQLTLPGLAGAGVVEGAATETAPAVGGLAASMGGLALAAAAVAVPLVVLGREMHDAGAEARAQAADVRALTTELEHFQDLPAPKQSQFYTDMESRIRAVIRAQSDMQTVFTGPSGGPGDNDPNKLIRGVSAVGDPKSQKALDDLHTSLVQLAKDQGILATKPFLDQLFKDAARVPGAMSVVTTAFGHMESMVAAATKQATADADKFAVSVGVGSAQAASAVAAYDAAMVNATSITDDTRKAGEQAAIALSGIGVAAGFAAQATVNGMSEAQIAVAGLMGSIQAGLDAASSTDSLLSAFSGVQQAEAGTASGGGGAHQTAAAAALDHAQKELAVRDAQRQVVQSATAVAQAQLQVVQSWETSREAAISLTAAELSYDQTLHGVVAGALEAKASTEQLTDARLKAREAVLSLAQAQNDASGSKLDVNDAKRALAQAVNDKGLYALAVKDARDKLAQDQQAQGGAQFAQTPHGSIQVSDSTAAAKDQIAKDQIALKDAMIAAGGAADSVTRAQLALSNAELQQKQRTIDLNAAHKAETETLHGYAKGSEEAQTAQTDLTNAQLSSAAAAQGIVTAGQGLISAQDNIATSALGLQRAELDLAGQLNSTSGMAGAFHDKATAVKQAVDQAKGSVYDWAQKQADASGQLRGSAGWAQVFVDKLTDLKNLIHPSGDLATFMNLLILQFQTLAAPTPVTTPLPTFAPGAGPTGTGVHIPGGGFKRAKGGNVTAGVEYTVGEYGRERFVPTENGMIVPNGVSGGGGRGGFGGGSTIVVEKTVQLTVVSMDPSQSGPLVVEALREEAKKGPITGVVMMS